MIFLSQLCSSREGCWAGMVGQVGEGLEVDLNLVASLSVDSGMPQDIRVYPIRCRLPAMNFLQNQSSQGKTR